MGWLCAPSPPSCCRPLNVWDSLVHKDSAKSTYASAKRLLIQLNMCKKQIGAVIDLASYLARLAMDVTAEIFNK